MTVFQSAWNPQGAVAMQRREAMLARIAALRALEDRAAQASATSKPVFDKRGQLLPRERVALLLDPGTPYLPLCSLAGFMQDHKGSELSVPGGGVVAGIGVVEGARCMIVASDSGIEAGAIQAMGLEKILRVQEIALQNKLPFIHLVESAGANLMRYRVEGFVHGGALFRNLARLSAAGIPVITVQHGSGTAGGAYMPGLSDVVIMVRNRSRAFLAGPPLLMAATGEVATEEELGGAEMHSSVSGLGEQLAEDDRHALGLARQVVARASWSNRAPAHAGQAQAAINSVAISETANTLETQDLRLSLPTGKVLLDGLSLRAEAGDTVLVKGPSGSGKSTLFRALAGIWPFSRGRTALPANTMFIPQRPYFPNGSLRDALAYPQPAGSYSDEALRQALHDALLPQLSDRLDDEDAWSQKLSGGEQQRLAIARVLLKKPSWVFADEATSALDEAAEKTLYERLVAQVRQAGGALVSIAHRPAVAAFHDKQWTLEKLPEGAPALYQLKETRL